MSGERQRKWQKKQRSLGKCVACNTSSIYRSDRCFRHHTLRLFANAGLRADAPKELRKREIMLAYLNGRYQSGCITGEEMNTKEDAPKVWSQLGFLNRRQYRESIHKTKRFALAFKRVLGALDRKAMRHYKAEQVVENGD